MIGNDKRRFIKVGVTFIDIDFFDIEHELNQSSTQQLHESMNDIFFLVFSNRSNGENMRQNGQENTARNKESISGYSRN